MQRHSILGEAIMEKMSDGRAIVAALRSRESGWPRNREHLDAVAQQMRLPRYLASISRA
jgi:hypothetical protein